MATNDDERRMQREHQYEIDHITALYVAEWRDGHSPKIEDFVQRYPAFERELLEFAVTFHTIGVDAPEPDVVAAAQLSPAAQRALASIRAQHPAPVPAPVASTALIEGLVQQGIQAGYTPAQLAAAVNLNTTLLARLEAHAIAAATIPRILIERLGQVLGVAPDAVASFLGAPPASQAGAFFYADQAPAQRQEPFLDAVLSSDLAPEAKRAWEAIAQGSGGNTP